ncbi:MAG: hypothetical protein QM645_05075 [Asticcacaulis sp.]
MLPATILVMLNPVFICAFVKVRRMAQKNANVVFSKMTPSAHFYLKPIIMGQAQRLRLASDIRFIELFFQENPRRPAPAQASNS